MILGQALSALTSRPGDAQMDKPPDGGAGCFGVGGFDRFGAVAVVERVAAEKTQLPRLDWHG